MVRTNALIREGGKTYRVIRIDGGLCFLFDRGDRLALPERRRLAEVLETLADGRAEVVDEDPDVVELALRVADGLPQEWLDKRDRAWHVVQELVESEDLLYVRTRNAAVKATAQKHGVSDKSIWRWLRKYWRDGLTPNALLPRYWESGPQADSERQAKAGSPNKRGPKPATGVSIEGDLRRAILSHLSTLINRNGMNFTQAWKVTHARLTVAGFSPLPSERQARYLWQKVRDGDPYGAIEEQHGARVAHLEYGAETSSPRTRVSGPGQEYEIDATPSNVWVVDPFTGKPLGRPTLYFVVDVFSSLIAGFNLTLDSPKYMAMSLALLNAMMYKPDYGQEIGIEIAAEEWPSWGLPELVRGDRGAEVTGYDSNAVGNTLRVHWQNTAPRMPKLKPMVESANRRIDEELFRLLPGYVFEETADGQPKDPRLTAALTLAELRNLVVNWIVRRNATHILKHYKATPAMMRAGVRAIPAELWAWGLSHGPGQLRTLPPDLMRLALMPQATATVEQQGIRFQGRYYTFDGPEADAWFRAAAASQTKSVKVRYDPDLINVLFVVDRNRLVRCHLTDAHQDLPEVEASPSDWQRYQDFKKAQEAEAEALEDARRAEDMAILDETVKEAEERRDALATGKTRTERRRGTKEARQQQLEVEHRARESAYPPPSPGAETAAAVAEPVPESYYESHVTQFFLEEDDTDV